VTCDLSTRSTARRWLGVLLVGVLAVGLAAVGGEPTTRLAGPATRAAVEAKPFFFFHCGDPQMGMNGRRGIAGDMKRFQSVAHAANRLGPAFVLVAGDLAHTRAKVEYAAFDRALKQFRVPVKLIPGNHDIKGIADLARYHRKYGKSYYSFTYNNCEFVCLNSMTLDPGSPFTRGKPELNRQAPTQLAWLAKTLRRAKANRRNHIFVLMHIPPFVAHEHEGLNGAGMSPTGRKALLKLVRRYGVREILVGHVHVSHSLHAKDFTVYSVAGTAKAFDAKGFGFRIFKVYPDRVEQQFVPLKRIPEQVELDRH